MVVHTRIGGVLGICKGLYGASLELRLQFGVNGSFHYNGSSPTYQPSCPFSVSRHSSLSSQTSNGSAFFSDQLLFSRTYPWQPAHPDHPSLSSSPPASRPPLHASSTINLHIDTRDESSVVARCSEPSAQQTRSSSSWTSEVTAEEIRNNHQESSNPQDSPRNKAAFATSVGSVSRPSGTLPKKFLTFSGVKGTPTNVSNRPVPLSSGSRLLTRICLAPNSAARPFVACQVSDQTCTRQQVLQLLFFISSLS